MSEVDVTSVIVKIGDVETVLTIDRAKQLLDKLKEVFNDKDHYRYIPYPVYRDPWPYRQQPIYYTSGTISNTTSGSTYTIEVA